VSFDAILVVEDGVMPGVNGRVQELYGYSEVELIGRTAITLVAPDCRAAVAKRIAEMACGTLELRHVRKDGTIFPVEVSTRRFEQDGRKHGVVAVRDITARKRAEALLAEREEQLRALADASFDAVFVSVDGIVQSVNCHASKLFGYDASEFIGHLAGRFGCPEFCDEVARRAANDVDGTYESATRHADGRVVHIEMSARTLHEGGRKVRINAVRDISQRKIAEARLRASEERFRRLAANVPGFVYQRALHPDGRVTYPYLNDGIREVCGIEPAEVRDNPAGLVDNIHPDDRDRFRDAIARSAKTLTPVTIDFRATHPAKGCIWLRTICNPGRQPDGTILWDGVSIDITDRVNIEAALDRTKRELERHVAAARLSGSP
jgi:PAS domain S-box-containing protein